MHHDTRWDLPLPTLAATLDYMADVAGALARRLAGREPTDAERDLYRLATFHEDMHGEAFTYSRQSLGWPAPAFAGTPGAAPGTGPWPGDVEVPGGVFRLGAEPGDGFVFDNEKWAHEVEVAPFRMARAPVTNAEYAAFVADDGYARRDLWSDAGWVWRGDADAHHPLYWIDQGDGGFALRRFDAMVPLAPHHPVANVCLHEAEAFCRWAGRRLPTEAEWEFAATMAPDGAKRRFPWGDAPWGDADDAGRRANLDGLRLGPVDVAAFAAGDSGFGCRQMIGNVWEWTSSDFEPYPGFSPDVYADYSVPSFGKAKVLRGGAWITRSRLVSARYRNYFPPLRRDIYAGFRTVAS